LEGSFATNPLYSSPAPDEGAGLAELIKELSSIDLDDPLANENELTMSDNNGGRIEL
jgi:hypothetical protein